MKKVPVFLIDGFIEAGKTQFILSTFRRDEFYKRGKTLLLVCEEGEVEYNQEELDKYNVEVEYLKENQINPEELTKIYSNHNALRIVMEMNMMWDLDKMVFPDFFEVTQIITIIDGTTFPIYFSNMRQKFIDAIKMSDVVAFTKLSSRETLQQFQTPLKIANSQCLFCLINEDCISTQEAFDTPLPYDLNKDSFTLTDDEFGIFYIDTFEHRESYKDKIVTFNAWVVKSNKLKKNEFIAGRKVLTCCANDIQLYGFLVKDSLGLNLKDDSWVNITAKIEIEYNKDYEEEEIVLYPINLKVIEPIKNQILDLR